MDRSVAGSVRLRGTAGHTFLPVSPNLAGDLAGSPTIVMMTCT